MKADKQDKELIMRRAWLLYKEKPGRVFPGCLAWAWEIQRLVCMMREGGARFCYRKEDGEGRRASGTLCAPWMPGKPKGAGRKPNPGVVSYWDIDRGGWRSFRVERFQGIG